MASSSSPQRFGDYWLLRRLGRGGMAELFLASPALPGREGERYALKRVLPHLSAHQDFLQMFLQEARLASQLAHPNIARVVDLGMEGGHLFIAMEYVDGCDLETLARSSGKILPPQAAAFVAAEICAALACAHAATGVNGELLHVVHRDVSPENVMVGRRGEVKLVDFGVAKATAKLGSTAPGTVKGKLSYLAPEHVLGRMLDGRADLFSLGALLYEVTTGVKPFHREAPEESLRAVLQYVPPPPDRLVPSYPPALAKIVLCALDKDRERRFAGAAEMREALLGYLAEALPPFGAADLGAMVSALPAPAEVEPPDPAEACVPTEPVSQPHVGLDPSAPAIHDPATVPLTPLAPPTPAGAAGPLPVGRELSFTAGPDPATVPLTPLAPLVPQAPIPPGATGPAATSQAPTRPARPVSSPPARTRAPKRMAAVGMGVVTLAVAGWLGLRAVGGEPPAQLPPSPPSPPPPAVVAPEPMPPEPVPPSTPPTPEPTPPAGADSAADPADDLIDEPAPRPGSPAVGPRPRPPVKDSRPGRLTLHSEPPCEVAIDGAPVGTTPLVGYSVRPGKRRVVLTNKSAAARHTMTIVVRPGEDVSERVAIPLGQLEIRVKPWAEVSVDGRKIGNTPLAPLTLAAGLHEVRLVNPELGKDERHNVAVRQGETGALRVVFE